MPLPALHLLQPQRCHNVSGGQGLWQVLLIRKDEDDAMPHEGIFDDVLEFTGCFGDAFSIAAIDNVDQGVGVVEVMTP